MGWQPILTLGSMTVVQAAQVGGLWDLEIPSSLSWIRNDAGDYSIIITSSITLPISGGDWVVCDGASYSVYRDNQLDNYYDRNSSNIPSSLIQSTLPIGSSTNAD